ncbi:MAG: acyltransferase [Burkholderiaceae bacterium]|nr:acyltransferase [Burkholderiaceae bacterium]
MRSATTIWIPSVLRGVDRWSLLALLRFALALIVAVNHLAEYAPLGPLAWLRQMGSFEAILGFLLVSGYSIGASYQKSPAGFYLRRAWRVYPVYAGAIVLMYAATPAELTPPLLGVLALNLLFLNQIFTTTSYVGPAWSLSLEVWLYALTPALARLSRSSILMLVLGSLVVYVIDTCGRTLFHWPYYAWQGFGLNLLTLSFPWLLGFLLANSPAAERQVLRWIACVLSGHILLAALIQFGYRLKHHSLETYWLVDGPEFVMRSVTLVLVWWCLRRAVSPSESKGRRSSWMTFLGDSSYPLYLTHIPVAITCHRFGINNAFSVLGIMLTTSAVLYLSLDSYSRSREKRLTVNSLAST